MGRIVNELDTIQFSIKKASQLVKEIGRQVSLLPLKMQFCFKAVGKLKLFSFIILQVATDKCIMLFLFLIVCGVIAIIIVKVWVLIFLI